jgi:hypothetical protein
MTSHLLLSEGGPWRAIQALWLGIFVLELHPCRSFPGDALPK